MKMRTTRPARVAILAKVGLLACLVGVSASACDTGYNFSTSQTGPGSLRSGSGADGSGSTTTTVPTADAPLCPARVLVATGGRRQDPDYSGGAIGDVLISNTSRTACEVRGIPSLRLRKADGSLLDVEDTQTNAPALAPVVVQPRGKSTAELVFTWQNWCGPNPGALVMQIGLSNRSGSLTAPLNGKLGSYVPTCGRPAAPSVLRVEYAYVPAGAANLASA